jgi:hypothetical protein
MLFWIHVRNHDVPCRNSYASWIQHVVIIDWAAHDVPGYSWDSVSGTVATVPLNIAGDWKLSLHLGQEHLGTAENTEGSVSGFADRADHWKL